MLLVRLEMSLIGILRLMQDSKTVKELKGIKPSTELNDAPDNYVSLSLRATNHTESLDLLIM